MENKNTNNDILQALELSLQEDLFQSPASGSTYQKEEFNIITHVEEDTPSQDNEFLESLLQQNTQSEILIQDKAKGNWKHNSIVSSIFFVGKYVFTSTLIFAILLIVSNFSAYKEIALSYLNPEALEQNKQALLLSIENTQITQKSKQNISTQESVDSIGKDQNSQEVTPTAQEDDEHKDENNSLPLIQEEVVFTNDAPDFDMVKNKTFHAMEKIIRNTTIDILPDIEIVPYENRIIIPKIGKNIPLIDVQAQEVKNLKELEDIFMEELVNGIVRYPGSARPGEAGNSFIFGHSSNFPWIKGDYNDVFALMDHLEFGDEIIAYYGQKKYVYKIQEKKIIKPGDVSVLKPQDQYKEITLMTCWPIGTTLNRMIVTGRLVEQ